MLVAWATRRSFAHIALDAYRDNGRKGIDSDVGRNQTSPGYMLQRKGRSSEIRARPKRKECVESEKPEPTFRKS